MSPELYRLMLSGPLSDRSRFPELQRAADEAFGALQRMLGAAGAGDRGGLPEPVALTAWSTVHGLAMLVIDGRIGVGPRPEEIDSVAEEVTRVLGRGLRSYGDLRR